jgi:hypothetical protein
MRHQDTQNAKNAFVTFGTRDELVQALEMNNFVPYDGAMPMLVAPASAPPAGRDGRSERRGGGGGFFDRDRDRYGGDSGGRDWSDVRSGAQQPSGNCAWWCVVVVAAAVVAVVVPMQHAFSYTPYPPPHLSGGRERGSDRFDRDRPYGDRAPATQRPTLNLQPRCSPCS